MGMALGIACLIVFVASIGKAIYDAIEWRYYTWRYEVYRQGFNAGQQSMMGERERAAKIEQPTKGLTMSTEMRRGGGE